MRRTLLFLCAAAVLPVRGAEIPTPPAGHPRLYARAADLPAIRARVRHPRLQAAWARVMADAKASAEGATFERAAEIGRSRALLYLLEGDEAAGRSAVEAMREVLPRANWNLEAQDISRAIGLVMLSAGMVYDWCYPLLSNEDKFALIEQMERLAGMLEVGYPPTRQSSVTGHAGEAMLLRDMLGAGIAMYDEKPVMYRVSAERIFGEHIPARNFFYPSHMHHQGKAYGTYRFRWEIAAAWILKRMTGRDYFSADQGQLPYQWIYSRRPDGKYLADGDVFSFNTTAVDMMTAAYYGDSRLQAAYRKAPDAARVDAFDQIFFSEPDLAEDSAELPLTRFFNFPLSSVIARTGWDHSGAVVAELKTQEYHFNNHDHLDAGTFQIYYRGPLAIDSGAYKGYGTEHDRSYYKRTIAHNAMLVYDPAERFTTNAADSNDGGQRYPANRNEPRNLDALLKNGYRVAEVLGRQAGPDPARPRYTYLEGDLTQAYSSKVRSYSRAFVFLNQESAANPASLVVFDRVASANPAFRKFWLLHSIEEPEIAGKEQIVRHNGGKLVNATLLPAEASIDKIGGPDREFWVFGANYPPTRPLRPSDEAGAWRIEISPGQPAEADLFLNVMQVMDEDASPFVVERIESDQFVGARIGRRAVLFGRRAERVRAEAAFTVPGDTPVQCVVTGLAAGEWTVNNALAATATQEGGALYFEAPPGAVTLRPR